MTYFPSDRDHAAPRRPIDQQAVDAACDRLLAAGERVTNERVRHVLGRGSPNTINPMIASWWAALASRINPDTARPEVPDAVWTAGQALWDAALNAARAEAAKLIEQERLQTTERLQQVEASAEAATNARDAALANLESLRAQLVSATERLDTERAAANEREQSLRNQLAEHVAKSASQTMRAEESAQRATAAEHARSQAASSHAQERAGWLKERTELTTSHDRTIADLSVRLDAATQAAGEAQRKRDSEVTAHRASREALALAERRADKAEQQATFAGERAASLAADLTIERARTSDLEARLRTAETALAAAIGRARQKPGKGGKA